MNKTNKSAGENYFIKYRGHYWEVNFNYPDPILIENSLGMYYLAFFAAHPNTPIDCYQLTNKYSKKSASISGQRVAKNIQKAIDDTIIKIDQVEKNFAIKNRFSTFLFNSKFRSSKNRISMSTSKNYTYSISFIPQVGSNIVWSVPIIPPYSIL